MTRLFCIFNRNDPTPTASALKNVAWDDAVVIIVGHSQFSKRHKNNLMRLKAWTKGSGKGNGWPDGVWNSEWDWEPIDHSSINYLMIESFDESILDGIKNGDCIDLTSGTKEQSGDLICRAVETGIEIELTLQVQGGTTLDLTTGISHNNQYNLSFRERIWLSSGFVIDAPNQGAQKLANIWLNAEIDFSGKKILPLEPMQLAKKLDWPHGLTRMDRENNKLVSNINHGYWLEYASSHLLYSWPNIVESYSGIRLIQPNFANAAGCAKFSISHGPVSKEFPSKFFDNSMDFHKSNTEWLTYLMTDELTSEQKAILRKYVHKSEFDAAALTVDGRVIICECKLRPNPDLRDINRINLITKQTFPISSVPVLVYGGKDTKMSNGVCLISWPDLAKPDIIEQIRQ